MLLQYTYVDGISTASSIYRNMMEPPPEAVCKPSQRLPTCPESDSKAHNLSSFTYMKNMSGVIESYFQGKSLILTEKLSHEKLFPGKCYLCMNPKFSLCVKHIISPLKVCLKASFFYADLCKARKSLLWYTQYLLGSVGRRGTQTLSKSMLGPGYMSTSPVTLQQGNPELGPSMGTEAAGDRAKDQCLIWDSSLSADEAALNMKFTLIYC